MRCRPISIEFPSGKLRLCLWEHTEDEVRLVIQFPQGKRPYVKAFNVKYELTDEEIKRCEQIKSPIWLLVFKKAMTKFKKGRGGWEYDEIGSMEAYTEFEETFISELCRHFKSFYEPDCERWHDRDRKVIMENGIFYVCLEDNQWSVAVELIQKEDPYDDHLSGLQAGHYEKYLEGIKQAPFEQFRTHGVYGGRGRLERLKGRVHKMDENKVVVLLYLENVEHGIRYDLNAFRDKNTAYEKMNKEYKKKVSRIGEDHFMEDEDSIKSCSSSGAVIFIGDDSYEWIISTLDVL